MKLKIASYNMVGGFYNDKDKTEFLDRKSSEKVDDRLLQQIIETINNEDIDVICFQEIITTEKFQYMKLICDGTNLKNYDCFELSENTMVKDSKCGIAIFSKYPIEIIKHELFPNPDLSKTTNSGNTYHIFDKGFMLVNIIIDNLKIKLLNHHGFPYKTFDSTAEENIQVFDFFDNQINEYKPDVVLGDFNVEDMMSLMPYTKNNYIRTIDNATTVKGKKLDDILIHKNVSYSSYELRLLSDHFMVVSNIEL